MDGQPENLLLYRIIKELEAHARVEHDMIDAGDKLHVHLLHSIQEQHSTFVL